MSDDAVVILLALNLLVLTLAMLLNLVITITNKVAIEKVYNLADYFVRRCIDKGDR